MGGISGHLGSAKAQAMRDMAQYMDQQRWLSLYNEQ